MRNRFIIKIILLPLIVCAVLYSETTYAQHSIYEPLNLKEVNSANVDFGTMWTFDDIPGEYIKKTYGFVPEEKWLENARLSSLQFGGGCSAAFVSQDGLIMTNHHCGRGDLYKIQHEDENLLRDGFYASSLEEERKIPDLYVDQLISIKDVTNEIISKMENGNTTKEKIDLRDSIMAALTADCQEETGLKCRIVTLYNGGKYSLYTYKRFDDIRLVMAPDFQIAATGWDWDNFTYPRYELDFAFYRAYDENGDPVKTDNYFTWSKQGAEEGEPIFVIGRPGNTDRLQTIVELEYYRDNTYPISLIRYNELYKVYEELFNKHPERESELLNSLLGVGNGRKSYAGRLLGLKDDYLMAKKTDFENRMKEKVKNNPSLNEKYGHIWKAIEQVIDELKIDVDKSATYTLPNWNRSVYYSVALQVVKYARQMTLPEEERELAYQSDKISETRNSMYPESFDVELNNLLIKYHANFLTKVLGKDNELLKNVYGGFLDNEAVNYALKKSKLATKEDFENLLKSEPDQILNCNDPFIYFVVNTQDELKSINEKRSEANNTLDVLHQEIGRLIFETYGNQIAPDATSTLRISDGVIKGYEYNGTIAPGKVTFYGLWDRYNSFNKKTYPWGLHPRWKTPPEELDLSIPVGFASTNDIVGGNSGSSIVNMNQEIVGLVHDGNLESLAGHFIFLPENNRTVATDSWGLMEALIHVYKTERLVKELQNSKIVD